MAIGRTFQESLQKALRGLEVDINGLSPIVDLASADVESKLRRELRVVSADRIRYLADAIRYGF